MHKTGGFLHIQRILKRDIKRARRDKECAPQHFAGKKAVYLLIPDSGEALQFQTVACVAFDEAQIALLIHRLERHKIILNRCADQEITYLRKGGKSVWDIDHCRFAGLFAENLRPGVRIEFLHGIQREIVDALTHIVRDADGLLPAHRSVPG